MVLPALSVLPSVYKKLSRFFLVCKEIHLNSSSCLFKLNSSFQWPLFPPLSPLCSHLALSQEAHAMQEKVSAQYKNEIEMAKAQRDYELKKAAYDIEIYTKKAESEMAYQLQVHMSKVFISIY